MTVRVLTWNVLNAISADWPARREAIGCTLEELAVDFIGLQEAMRPDLGDLLARPRFGARYAVLGFARDPHPEDNPPRRSTVGRADLAADDRRDGEFAALFYRHDRFDYIPLPSVGDPPPRGDGAKPHDAQSIWFHSDSAMRHTPGARPVGAAFPRVFTWGRFIERATGCGLHVYSTHFEHADGPEKRAIRLAAARQMVEHIALLPQRKTPEPVVVMGDLNDTPDSEPIRLLTTALQRLCSDVPTCRGFDPADRGEKIDYILAARGVRLLRFQQLAAPMVTPTPRGTDGRVSDHDVLAADIEID